MLKVLLTVGFLQLLTMLVLMVRTKVLALLLGPDQYGLMGAMDRLVAVFAQTASLSMPFAALRYLSPLWHSDPSGFQDLFRRMRNVVVGLLLLATAGGLATAAHHPGWLGSELVGHRGVLMAALAGVPIVGLLPFLQNVVAARFDHRRAMLLLLAHALLLTATAIAGVLWAGLFGFYLLYASCGLAFIGTALFRAGRSDARVPAAERAAGPLRLPRRVWRFALLLLMPAFLSPAVAYAVYHGVIEGHGEQVGGYMQAAVGISIAVRGVLGAAHAVFLTPQVNREGPFEERVEQATNFQRTFFFLTGAVVPPLLMFSDLAVWLLYSREFLPGAPYVTLFVVLEIVTLSIGTYQALVLAMDHIAYHVAQNVVAQLCMYAVAILTIPEHGILGAALAQLSAQACLGLGTFFYLRARHGLRISPRVLALGALVVAALLASGWLSQRFSGLGLLELAVRAGAYAAIGGSLALFLDAEDRANLRRLLGELRSRLGLT